MSPFIAAIIQDTPVFLNLQETIAKSCDLIDRAAATGARIIAFPETWLPGYPVWLDEAPGAGLWDHPPAKALFAELYENSITIPSPEIEELGKAAQRNRVTVVMGAHERVGGTLYNTLFYIDPTGAIAGIHRKIMPTYTERMIWGYGDGSTLTVIDTPEGKLGGLICWEHWMPLLRAAMHNQQELVHIAQWPTVKDTSHLASRHYAFEGQCFVLAAGTILNRTDLPDRPLLNEIPADRPALMRGGSAIIAPDGSYLAGPVYDRPAILTAEIDPRKAIEGRLALDTAGHYSRPDIFQLQVNTAPLSNIARPAKISI